MFSEAEKSASRLLPRLWQADDVPAIKALLDRDDLPLPEAMVARALTGRSGVDAACGVFGFSFPLWRFLSQNAGGPSLLEAFGMRRLSRPTDLRDAALPDPARDEFGAGFALETGGFYIEYRRAYLLCARLDAAGAVAIRNNSYFFGRDRLPHPVMASTQAGSAEEWQSLTAGDFNEGGRFQPLAGQNISGLVGRLQVFDAGLHQWLVTDGLPWLLAFLRAKLALGRGLPFIGFVEAGRPPWRPRDVEPLSERLIEHMAENPASLRRHGWHLALLSGPAGDVPLA